MEVRSYRWDLVPGVSRREFRLLEALASRWPQASEVGEAPAALAPLSVELGPVHAYSTEQLRERLADPTAFALRLRREDGAFGFAVVPGPVGADCAARIFGWNKPRLGAPRPATRAEQGACALAAAALLERYGLDAVSVEPWHEPPAVLPALFDGDWTLGTDARVEVAGVRGTALVLAAESVVVAAPRPRPVGRALARGGHWLDGARIRAPVVSGVGRVAMRDVLALARRDVVILDRPPSPSAGRLAVGRGGFPVELTEAEATIAGPYERGPIMDEAVAEDVTVEVACQLGTVQLTARRVLELSPGQVLSLDRPLGGPVELVVGTRVIGRGELVDVDGELGVRVVELASKRDLAG